MMSVLRSVFSKVVDLLVPRREDLDPVIYSDEDFLEIYKKCKDYTMASLERMFVLYYFLKKNKDLR